MITPGYTTANGQYLQASRPGFGSLSAVWAEAVRLSRDAGERVWIRVNGATLGSVAAPRD